MRVQFTLEVNEDAWLNLMTPELWKEIKTGGWRVLSIGFDRTYGVGSFMLRNDKCPKAPILSTALEKLCYGVQEQLNMISHRCMTKGLL